MAEPTSRPVCLITGAAGGIGRALVAGLLDDGWKVVALDRDAQALARLPDAAVRLTCDVADEAQVAEAFAALGALQPGGAPGLDLLVHCAGNADQVTGPVEHLPLSAWRAMVDGHLTGAFLVVRSAVPLLRARRGAVVLIGSIRALQSEPHCEAYAAAKGGIVGLTHALAVSLGPAVRVNAILPGWIVTRDPAALSARDHAQHPVGRAGEPADVLGAVRWLASDGAGFVTGQAVVLDGGLTRRLMFEG